MNGRLAGVALVAGFSLLVTTTVVAAEEGERRLKFRDRGPACMCTGGLSEEDIRRAERQRKEPGERRSGGTKRLDGENTGTDEKQRGDN
ncbi:hypothetical protein [Thiohalomonas denitrificans]|uniref:Secreted protein n=1 Tax=Thiohalomonas denitrificans TaxID=415747 RepID=A0A1G5Q9Q6_9GAMM|nr:hypothetical protein [Thiohalomonas denitrificans]SCZ58009.1 hypothetical protein SAMN03097708_01575 [Thiohalomonas denitrificans]